MTVRYNVDYPLQFASYVPANLSDQFGTSIGNRDDSFETWCINPLPRGLYHNLAFTGGFEDTGVLQKSRQLGGDNKGNTVNKYMAAITDVPVVTSNRLIYEQLNAKTMFDLNKEYRIAWMSVTFTIPENTSGAPNRHVFIEWTNLPHATPCRPSEAASWLLDMPTTAIDTADSPPEDYGGWNWICNPIDIATACSQPGKISGKHGWQRAMLTAGSPVTITWRPRHANIKWDAQETLDLYSTTGGRISPVDKFGTKWSRGYLPTHDNGTKAPLDETSHLWMGPIIRMVDADIPISSANKSSSSQGDLSLAEKYNVRCNLSMVVKFRRMQANDPYFPGIRTLPNDNLT